MCVCVCVLNIGRNLAATGVFWPYIYALGWPASAWSVQPENHVGSDSGHSCPLGKKRPTHVRLGVLPYFLCSPEASSSGESESWAAIPYCLCGWS